MYPVSCKHLLGQFYALLLRTTLSVVRTALSVVLITLSVVRITSSVAHVTLSVVRITLSDVPCQLYTFTLSFLRRFKEVVV